jgi:hypothetical protein
MKIYERKSTTPHYTVTVSTVFPCLTDDIQIMAKPEFLKLNILEHSANFRQSSS